MIKRDLMGVLHDRAKQFKAVLLTGPRQSGKTTLARMAFPDKPYVSLENPDERMAALADPRSFLARFPRGAILDEAQRTPQIFSYLQQIIDESNEKGLFVITGSQHLGLVQTVTQSLAGRVALIELLPFTNRELLRGNYAADKLEFALFNGGYPPVFDQGIKPDIWYNNYIGSYIERDVRQILNVKNLLTFQRFMALCAGNMGQLFNASRLGGDCGIASVTAAEWLSVLEGTYLTFRLPPWHTNFRKRVVKTPKLYFWDTGLAIRLLTIQTPGQLLNHPLRGAIFENWVVSEYFKQQLHCGKCPNLYFWRDSGGLEIDLLVDDGTNLKAIEIKSGATFSTDWVAGLNQWYDLASRQLEINNFVVYGGSQEFEFKACRITPWTSLGNIAVSST